MDQASAFNVIYVDRRAQHNRKESRANHTYGEVSLRNSQTKCTTTTTTTNGAWSEHVEVGSNIRTLLTSFISVTICTSGPACISVLSDLDPDDPTPLLVLLDIPLHPDLDEESHHDGRHDSGVASGPADMIYGLPLLKYIAVEIENMRISASLIPIAIVSSENSAARDLETCDVRTIQCMDNGAWDAFKGPTSVERAKSLYMQCYRARKTARKARRRSWVGIDDRVIVPEVAAHSYLRERMVSELMMDICHPKHSLRGKLEKHEMKTRIKKPRRQDAKEAIARWDFSAHDFTDDELVYCAQLMFEHAFQMPKVAEYRIPRDQLIIFLSACRAAYNDKIPYHNFRHVVDVLQAVFYFLLQLKALPPYPTETTPPGGRPESAPRGTASLASLITPIDALTLLVVAIGHDVGHPGVNNAFLVTLKAPLAQVYNDRSVLESFHCAAFSQILRKHWPKILDMRKMVIDMILATDMGLHFDYMGKLDKLMKKLEKDGNVWLWDAKTIADQRTLLCALLIKCADISNVARHHECSARWATILIEEFARQANMEVELDIPTSLIAPPVTGSVLALAKSQVGFMSLFALPLFENLSCVLPEMGFSVKELSVNKDLWSRKVDAFKDEPNSAVSASPRPGASDKAHGKDNPPMALKKDPTGCRPRRNNLPPVLGTVLVESDIPPDDGSRSPTADPGAGNNIHSSHASSRSVFTQHHSSNGNPAAVTLVVTHPKPPLAQPNGFDPSLSEKKPTFQHSTEHLREDTSSESSSPDRPRSSPPDLGDASEHSCSKACCGPTVVTSNTVERRSSRFFKKVKIWKPWRKDSNEG